MTSQQYNREKEILEQQYIHDSISRESLVCKLALLLAHWMDVLENTRK